MADGQSADLPLFRREVLDTRQAQWLGSIRIGWPLGFSVVTGASLAMAAALVAFAYRGAVTRKATVHGLLLPVGGRLNVAAPQAGTIAEMLLHQGEDVQAGKPLLGIRVERITAQRDPGLLTALALAARRASLAAERQFAEQNMCPQSCRDRAVDKDTFLVIGGSVSKSSNHPSLRQRGRNRTFGPALPSIE